jgi:DNA-binding NarL/FixJ family response regulator
MDTSIAVQEPTRAVETNNVGRPCKYETYVEPRLQEIEEWIREGLTDYCIADNLGIRQETLIRYKESLK